MKVEKATLKYIFDSKSLEFFSQLRPEYFKRPMTNKIFKALRSYVGAYHTIPSISTFKSKLSAKLPEGKKEVYSGFLDSIADIKVEETPKELLGVLKEHYIVKVLDDNVEALVEAAQTRNVEAIKRLVKKIEGDITTEEKLPEDIASSEYTPSKVKLIEPFLETMKTNGLLLGGLTIIGGTSGGGKSIFTLQQLLHSFKNGEDVCLLNLELGLDETIARLYSMDTGEEFSSIYGNSDPKVIEKINKWKASFFGKRENKFYIKNTSFDSIEIESIIRAMEKKGVHIFGIDYLNLVEINTEEEWRGLSKLVKLLHRLTQELSLVIITPTQVNLTDTKEKEGELKVTARGSRELEFSSTVFLFIYQTKEEFESNVARIFTIKARNAAKKTYVVETDFSHMKFKDTGMVL